MPITPATTHVWIRVDQATNRIIAVTDIELIDRPGQPAFQVAANFPNIDYYVIEKNPSSTHGITVRAATADERTAIDAVNSATASAAIQRSKDLKAMDIKNLYDAAFIRRFVTAAFMSEDDILAVCAYTGSDVHLTTVTKVLAQSVQNAYVEWRNLVCQPVIQAMYDDPNGLGIVLDNEYRIAVEDTLDAFLTAHSLDIATYHR